MDKFLWEPVWETPQIRPSPLFTSTTPDDRLNVAMALGMLRLLEEHGLSSDKPALRALAEMYHTGRKNDKLAQEAALAKTRAQGERASGALAIQLQAALDAKEALAKKCQELERCIGAQTAERQKGTHVLTDLAPEVLSKLSDQALIIRDESLRRISDATKLELAERKRISELCMACCENPATRAAKMCGHAVFCPTCTPTYRAMEKARINHVEVVELEILRYMEEHGATEVNARNAYSKYLEGVPIACPFCRTITPNYETIAKQP